MVYNIEFIRTILKLSEENKNNFNEFLFDICKYFPNNFEEYNKVITQFNDGKRQFINRRYNDFIKKYRGLLGIFAENEVLNNLTFSAESYKQTLKLVKYLLEKTNVSDKMFECINGLQNLKIEKLNFVDELPFAIKCSETKDGNYYSLHSVYTDGNNVVEYTKQHFFTTDYIMDVSNANYIICYSKNNMDGLKDLSIQVKNLEFDPSTLPNYHKLHGKNGWQNLNKNKMKTFHK